MTSLYDPRRFRASLGQGRRFSARAKADASGGELYLYDVIGGDFFGGISSRDVQASLASMGAVRQLDVYLNSPGGDVFEGIAIGNLLARFPAPVTIHVDGLAASIASVIAMAGKRIAMAPNAMMMIHDPWAVSMGGADEMRKMADTLDQVAATLGQTYATRTRQTPEAVRAWMAAETWMDSATAVERGFADCIEPDGDEMGAPDEEEAPAAPRQRAAAVASKIAALEERAVTMRRASPPRTAGQPAIHRAAPTRTR